MNKTSKDDKHKAAMQKQKANVDASIKAADTERGVALLPRECCSLPAKEAGQGDGGC